VVDQELAHHCLQDFGSVNSPNCPIIKERTLVMADNTCDGLSIRDQLFSFLVEAVQEMADAAEKGKKRRLAKAEGQVAALTYAIALMDNPYDVDVEGVLAQAEEAATHPEEVEG
jgi:hypothetical protein